MNCRFVLLVTLAYTLALGADVEKGGNKSGKNGSDPSRGNVRVPKQVGSSAGTVDDSKDRQTSAGHHFGHGHGHHFGHGHGHGLGHGHGGHYGDSKYFQYAHNPNYGEYEFGYRRGNDYHFQERYERAHGWNFKTKVKWGDKYAGYGEHYWDYNHPDKGYDHGHGGGGGGGGSGGGGGYDEHGHGHYSENAETYAKPDGSKIPNKRQSTGEVKGEQDVSALTKNKKPRVAKTTAQPPQQQARLMMNPVNGQITDQATGKKYVLKPANN